jgi:hypothetical protein
VGRNWPDWEDNQYMYPLSEWPIQCFGLSLIATYGRLLMQKQGTCYRVVVLYAKRFAVVIYWLTHWLSFNSLGHSLELGSLQLSQ